MSDKQLSEMLGKCFVLYPSATVFYVTSDFQFFEEKNKTAAQNHAQTLKNKELKEFKKVDFESKQVDVGKLGVDSKQDAKAENKDETKTKK